MTAADRAGKSDFRILDEFAHDLAELRFVAADVLMILWVAQRVERHCS